jgi:hypothetical protein
MHEPSRRKKFRLREVLVIIPDRFPVPGGLVSSQRHYKQGDSENPIFIACMEKGLFHYGRGFNHIIAFSGWILIRSILIIKKDKFSQSRISP